MSGSPFVFMGAILCAAQDRASGRDDVVVLVWRLLGAANEERETAGSLAPLGMTNKKQKQRQMQKLIPCGNDNQKGKGKSRRVL